MIESFRFGKIKIDGAVYKKDVEVRSGGEVLSWRRENGHVVSVKDLKRALKENPDIIVLGTGDYARARVSEETREELKKQGIRIVIDETSEAVEAFNVLLKKNEGAEPKHKIIGLFHLTC